VNNREALLEAGIGCLHEHGYADTTARNIAGRAKVSLGGIGYHFGSTQALMDEALAEAVRRWFEPLIGLLAPLPEHFTVGQLGNALDRLFATFAANRPLVVAYFEALVRAERSTGLRAAMAADFDALRTAVRTGIEQLEADQPDSDRLDPDVGATLIMAAFDGLIIQWLLDPERVPTGAAITEMLQRAARLTVPSQQ
jgi:AcrR family transcriptional regulator